MGTGAGAIELMWYLQLFLWHRLLCHSLQGSELYAAFCSHP